MPEAGSMPNIYYMICWMVTGIGCGQPKSDQVRYSAVMIISEICPIYHTTIIIMLSPVNHTHFLCGYLHICATQIPL